MCAKLCKLRLNIQRCFQGLRCRSLCSISITGYSCFIYCDVNKKLLYNRLDSSVIQTSYSLQSKSKTDDVLKTIHDTTCCQFIYIDDIIIHHTKVKNVSESELRLHLYQAIK